MHTTSQNARSERSGGYVRALVERALTLQPTESDLPLRADGPTHAAPAGLGCVYLLHDAEPDPGGTRGRDR
jgi:hypothetical protein